MRRARDIRGLVDILERGIVSGSDADELCHRLETVFGTRGVIIGQHVSFDAWNVCSNVPFAWMETHKKLEHEDVIAERLTGRPPGTFFMIDADYAKRTDLRRPHRMQHLYPAFRAAGLRDLAATRLYNPFRDDMFFAMYRPEGAPPFSEDDRVALEMLNPLLAGALAARRSLAALHAPRTESHSQALRRVRAYAHVSWPGPRVEWSDGALELFGRHYGKLTGGRRRSIERAIAQASVRFSTAHVGGKSQLLVAGIRIEFAYLQPERGDDRRMLVLFVEEPQPFEGHATPAAQLLSARELSIAEAAARGDSSVTIAAALGISFETARSHLKSVYAKLRVSSRAELAMLLAPRRPGE